MRLGKGQGFEMPLRFRHGLKEIGELDSRSRYKGCGEKCILQPLSRATEAARRILPNKNIGKICGVLATVRARTYGDPDLAGGATGIRTENTVDWLTTKGSNSHIPN
jgi:hypothetical protein